MSITSHYCFQTIIYPLFVKAQASLRFISLGDSVILYLAASLSSHGRHVCLLVVDAIGCPDSFLSPLITRAVGSSLGDSPLMHPSLGIARS